MEHQFWHNMWEEDHIPFHKSEAHPFLTEHLQVLSLPEGARIFVPLCGKSLDMHWLRQQGYHIIGAELSAIAIDQLFIDLNVTPTITERGDIKHYHAQNIDIFVGDLFDVHTENLGKIDAIYDRGSLVALPPEVRIKYAKHLTQITKNAPQILIAYQYDQAQMDGPPFAISNDELQQHYGATYHIKKQAYRQANNDKNQRPFEMVEIVWTLSSS